MADLLDRRAILGVISLKGIRTKEVPVPEWGTGADAEQARVLVRELPASEVSRLGMVLAARGVSRQSVGGQEYRVTVVGELADQFPSIVAACAVDRQLDPLFSEPEVRRFGSDHSSVLQRIAVAALTLSDLWASEDDDESDALKESLDEHAGATEKAAGADDDSDPNA